MKYAGRIALDGLLCAVAIVLGLAESFLPAPLPGVKLGLANCATLTCLLLFSPWDALCVMLIRVLVCAIWSGGWLPLLYSAAGALLSYSVMVLLKRIFSDRIGTVTISMAGALAHNLGQTLVAMVFGGIYMVTYLPVLAVSGIICGLLVGLLVGLLCRRLAPLIRRYRI